MTLRFSILILLFAAVVSSACSSTKPVEATSSAEPAAENSGESVASALPPVVTAGEDNSEIAIVHENGIKIETRTFKDHPQLTSVVIKTLPDKTMTGIAYGRDGSSITLQDHQIALAFQSTGNELATMVGMAPEEPVAVTQNNTEQSVIQSPAAPIAQPVSAPVFEKTSLMAGAQPAVTADPNALQSVDQTAAAPATPDPAAIERERAAAKQAAEERIIRLQRKVTGDSFAVRKKQSAPSIED